MKLCPKCSYTYQSENWCCPACQFEPVRKDDVCYFAPDVAEGFVSESFDLLEKLEPGHFWFEARNRLIIQELNAVHKKGNFLEIGCGTGFVLSGIQRCLPQITLTGSELYPEGIAVASSRLPDVTFYQMDARALPFEAEFDAIGIFDVLEHIAEDEVVLQEIYRSLKPGGNLLLTVPQHRFLWSVNDEFGHHQRRYSRSELRQKVSRAGFRIQKTSSFMTSLLPFMLLSRMRATSSVEDYDPSTEFQIPRIVNAVFYRILSLETILIKWGISLPIGGSLFMVAKRPE